MKKYSALLPIIAALISQGSLAQTQKSSENEFLKKIPDLVKEAESNGCMPYLNKAANAELLAQPDEIYVNRAYFKNIEGKGRARDVFGILVTNPAAQLRKLNTRNELDQWRKNTRDIVDRSQPTNQFGDATPSIVKNWNDFQSAAFWYHSCSIKALFQIDLVAEAKQKEEEKNQEINKFSKQYMEVPENLSFSLLCDRRNAPASRAEALVIYNFLNSGRGFMMESNVGRSAICQSMDFSWNKNGNIINTEWTNIEGKECGGSRGRTKALQGGLKGVGRITIEPALRNNQFQLKSEIATEIASSKPSPTLFTMGTEERLHGDMKMMCTYVLP